MISKSDLRDMISDGDSFYEDVSDGELLDVEVDSPNNDVEQ